MSKKRVIVTGGSGKAGYWIVKHFLEQGYDVINVDNRRPAEAVGSPGTELEFAL